MMIHRVWASLALVFIAILVAGCSASEEVYGAKRQLLQQVCNTPVHPHRVLSCVDGPESWRLCQSATSIRLTHAFGSGLGTLFACLQRVIVLYACIKMT